MHKPFKRLFCYAFFCYAVYLEIKLHINLESAWETFSSYGKSIQCPRLPTNPWSHKTTHSTIFWHEWGLKKLGILFWKEKFATSLLSFPLIVYKCQLVSSTKEHFAHNTENICTYSKGLKSERWYAVLFISPQKSVQSKEDKTTTYRNISTGLAVWDSESNIIRNDFTVQVKLTPEFLIQHHHSSSDSPGSTCKPRPCWISNYVPTHSQKARSNRLTNTNAALIRNVSIIGYINKDMKAKGHGWD